MGKEMMVSKIACEKCGGIEYRYKGDGRLGGYKFHGYVCEACGSEMAIDDEAMLEFVELESKKPLLSQCKGVFLDNNE